MTMQTDVKSKWMDATGASGVGGARTRIKAIYYVSGASAGTISITDGGSGGTERIKASTPTAANSGAGTILIPGEGVLFDGDPYVTLTNVAYITFFYG
jgi:hypothetical protein